MDILISLFAKADEQGLLAPLSNKPFGHRMYIYADDVVFFVTPSSADLSLIKSILLYFREASGLKTNMTKSTILPIRCDEGHEQQLPSKYLGLPFC